MKTCHDYNMVPHTDKNGMIYWVRENCQSRTVKGTDYCAYHQPNEAMGAEISEALAKMQSTLRRKHKPYFEKTVRQPYRDE